MYKLVIHKYIKGKEYVLMKDGKLVFKAYTKPEMDNYLKQNRIRISTIRKHDHNNLFHPLERI